MADPIGTDALLDRIAELEATLADAADCINSLNTDHLVLQARAETADVLLANAMGALSPFANCANELDGDAEIKRTPDDEWAKFRLLASDYRLARITLAELEETSQ